MMTSKDRLSRRQFVRLGALGAIAWTAAACGLAPTAPPADATPAPFTPGPATTPTKALKLLYNENRAGFYIRYYRPFPAVDANIWRLDVKGLVEEPRSFSLADLLALPHTTLEARMKCVECWSARAVWGGFTYQALAELVRPKPEARYLRFDCADGYWEHASIEEASNPRALFVTHMNDEKLPDEYGAPLRMMFPWKYGYKSAKAVVSIEFKKEGGDGYWSAGGAYTVDGDIEPGFDHPLDQGAKARPIKGGEITEY
jgi:sulfoxide reductase catalytic subunit YedY